MRILQLPLRTGDSRGNEKLETILRTKDGTLPIRPSAIRKSILPVPTASDELFLLAQLSYRR